MTDLIERRGSGLYCPAGDFYIDPWRPVARAVITHGHADHARAGHSHYLASQSGVPLLRHRLGSDISVQGLALGDALTIGRAQVSLLPAGHVLGAAQVRVEVAGEVWVASGDYRVQADSTCTPFEPVRCHTFITESTFALPVFRWEPQSLVMAQLNDWWQDNARQGLASVLYCYSLGKAQRVLAGVDPAIGPIVCHRAVQGINEIYRQAGVALPATVAPDDDSPPGLAGALVIAPPSVAGSAWLKRFGPQADAFVSGWMQVRGLRRRRAVDRGFVLSDHADWPGLLQAIEATGAQRIIVTHGQEAVLVRWLREQGRAADSFETGFGRSAHGHDASSSDAPPR
ncbi:MAG: ligase-associated DNA damage response exonuclease [Burkholderiaceae bacterium]